MLFKSLIAKYQRCYFIPFIVHDTCIIVCIDVAFFLPRAQLFNKSTGFVLSSLHGLLEGLNDGRNPAFLVGFFGEDNRIRDVRIKFGRNGRRNGSVFFLGRVWFRLWLRRGVIDVHLDVHRTGKIIDDSVTFATPDQALCEIFFFLVIVVV